MRMESKKNMHARAALNQRRELRSEVSQRRELEILEQAEQERLRQFRSAQEREHHRTWRSRSRSDEVEGGIDQASGEGSAGAQEEDNPNGDEPKNDGCEVCDKFEENGGGESSGEEESLESNVVLT
ncbi:hypothetical protein KC19_VG066700 [Ceratodon purpureus]|uniref:Uncharacterized protein n=1 Tax=Ceratodon purpureus TaxID=3225 RepID=A0A8T0HN21_CERPU|nr:hypothetical protein KC19_VG066700 [Ceratodon purpureus]